MKKLLAAALAVLASSVWTAGAQDETAELAQRLERLRRDVIDLQAYVYNAGELPASSGEVAAFDGSRLHADIQQIHETLRTIAGRIDDLEFDQRQLREQVAGLETKLVAKTAGNEAGGAVETVAVETPPADDDAGLLPPGSVMEQYNHAFSLLRKADYEAAESAFREFIGLHPQSDLTGNAWYWLGSTHFVREQFHDAAVAYLKGYRHEPDGPKAAGSLLKLAVTLARLGKIDESCATFRELAEKFSDAGETIRAEAGEEAAAAGCV